MNELHHIAIAVKDIDAAIELWTRVLSFRVTHRETVHTQKTEVAILSNGAFKIELVSPLDDDSPVAKFLKTRGEGLHHIAISAESANSELARLKSLGVRSIDETARRGAEGTLVGFAHPASLNGVLLEIVEDPSA